MSYSHFFEPMVTTASHNPSGAGRTPQLRLKYAVRVTAQQSIVDKKIDFIPSARNYRFD
jgi:hypothetical protein